MIVATQISYGYMSLIDIFLKANNLDVTIADKSAYPHGKIDLEYVDNSETALAITMLSYKHLGFENMLCDYLIRCGIPSNLISIGKAAIKRDQKELDKECDKHLRSIGFKR